MSDAALLVATRSVDKLREIHHILGPELPVVGLDDAGFAEMPEEVGLERFDSFEANALAKARFFAAHARRPVIADDSGLCVDALHGAPGVHSKRFSGRQDLRGAALDAANNTRLLERLQDVPDDRRNAHYVCVIAFVAADGAEHLVRGRCDGVILHEAHGAGGFGYDPLFFLPAEGATFGELPAERKNLLSHRARAVRAAKPLLLATLLRPHPDP